MLKSCFLLLRPGGWFAAAVPLIDSVQAAVFGSRWAQVTEAPRHISLPSRRGLQAAFEQVGFSENHLVADSVPSCAGSAGLSIIPSGTTHAVYGEPGIAHFPARMMAIGAALVSVAWCTFDNLIVHRPALGIMFGRKPPGCGAVG
jgi:hypothetical protein